MESWALGNNQVPQPIATSRVQLIVHVKYVSKTFFLNPANIHPILSLYDKRKGEHFVVLLSNNQQGNLVEVGRTEGIR